VHAGFALLETIRYHVRGSDSNDPHLVVKSQRVDQLEIHIALMQGVLNALPQQAIPQQAIPQQAIPQQAILQQAIPQQAILQQAILPAQPAHKRNREFEDGPHQCKCGACADLYHSPCRWKCGKGLSTPNLLGTELLLGALTVLPGSHQSRCVCKPVWI
jgi:hypothetical protein